MNDRHKALVYAAAMAARGPELVIGLVAPVGTRTTELAREVQGSLSGFDYKVVPIKLSDLLPTAGPAPVGEAEDERILRLIAAGNQFCKDNDGDAAAVACLAIRAIRERRIALLREDRLSVPYGRMGTEPNGNAR
jgi:hypothetical protein